MSLSVEQEYQKLLTDWAVLPDVGIGLIELTGADALEWLQGQATNDLRSLGATDPVSFCLCEPTGQLLAVCDIWIFEGRMLIATDNAAALMQRAETMVILEDVVAHDLSNQFSLLSVQGPRATIQIRDFYGQGSMVLKRNRLGLEGFDVWSPNSELSTNRISEPAYEMARIEAGVPKRGVDYTNKTLPPELGPAFESAHVSYNKGCYTGQEVLMRMHSRGHTNKTLIGLLLESPVEVGAKISHPTREDAGVISSAAVSPTLGPIAAATLRNEAAIEGAEVLVGSVRGRVRQMPLRKN